MTFAAGGFPGGMNAIQGGRKTAPPRPLSRRGCRLNPFCAQRGCVMALPSVSGRGELLIQKFRSVIPTRVPSNPVYKALLVPRNAYITAGFQLVVPEYA